jgi:two-component system response regulator FlrC
MNQSAVLVVEDDMSLCEALCDTLELAGYRAESAPDGIRALDLLRKKNYDIVISDVQMEQMDGHALLKQIKKQTPDLPVLLMTAYGTIEKAVQAMREGAIDYLVKPFEAEVLIKLINEIISQQCEQDSDFIAQDPRSQDVMQIAKRVAASDATIMITGESGVGKEVLARFIHNQSSRAGKPFVAINCAAIPENMLEATLFGYEKGAFTGAYKSSAGKFEQAQGGTLLLDEISEMDLALQAKLLRVLQEREVERLGGHKTIELDVRVLATSNRNMREEVTAGRFREDLFYRLNVFPIALPALRERKQDIVPLAQRFIHRAAKALARRTPVLTEDAKQRLQVHSWPGNVRELDNVIQRAMILQVGEELSEQELHFEVIDDFKPTENVVAENPGNAESGTLQTDVKSHEHNLILETLRKNNGNRKITAEQLGISQRTLRYKLAGMREKGIDIPG